MKTVLAYFAIFLSISATSFAQENNWSGVEKVFGKKGMVKNGVFRITFPRSDLKIKVGDFPVEPGLALTSWLGITNMGMNMDGNYMMMGDMVLLDKEVAPVLSKLFSEGLSVTAIHNHLLNESPTVKYIHFSGKGDAVKLAESMKSVLSVTGTPMGEPKTQTASTEKPDWSKVEVVLGNTGKANGKVLAYGFPRNEKLTESGMAMPPEMGMGTGINFQMEGNKAAIAGDFVLLADEVNPVAKALTDNGVAVTAIHNHMLYDDPRLFMMHVWAVGDPEKLAKAVKEALDKTNSKK